MIILTTDTDQLFATIPTRQVDEYANDRYMKFTNETTKEVSIKEVINFLSYGDVFIIGTDNFDFLSENIFYELEVYFGNTFEVIYRDRVFCTNQETNEFTINENQYTLPNIDNNSYITI